MHIFIYSQLLDAHAIVVKAALESLGVRVTRFRSDQFPENSDISCSFSNSGSTLNLSEAGMTILDASMEAVDVVWLRRPSRPNVTGLDLHIDDVDVVRSECNEFWQSFLPYSFPSAVWINPLSGAKYAKSKLVQLTQATHCGLQIPRTLFSNDSDKIRAFITENNVISISGTIIKSLQVARWEKNEQTTRAMYASKVELSDLPTDELLHAVPAIYQQNISKAFEVRSTFFGRKCLHAKIIAQSNGTPLQDWRTGYTTGLTIEPHFLPAEVEERCFQLMDQLGIVFGCFDFIVTPEGDYVFLEVNEAGQFLFVEALCPEIKMLSAFCEFILAFDPTKNAFVPEVALTMSEVTAWSHVQKQLAIDEAVKGRASTLKDMQIKEKLCST